jgi:hypothetical protein
VSVVVGSIISAGLSVPKTFWTLELEFWVVYIRIDTLSHIS